MTLQRVRARLMSGCDAVGDVSPMIRRGVARIDTCRLGCIDRGEHLADLGPALDLEQDVAAGPHERPRRERLASTDRPHDVDARADRAVVVRSEERRDGTEGVSPCRYRWWT